MRSSEPPHPGSLLLRGGGALQLLFFCLVRGARLPQTALSVRSSRFRCFHRRRQLVQLRLLGCLFDIHRNTSDLCQKRCGGLDTAAMHTGPVAAARSSQQSLCLHRCQAEHLVGLCVCQRRF